MQEKNENFVVEYPKSTLLAGIFSFVISLLLLIAAVTVEPGEYSGADVMALYIAPIFLFIIGSLLTLLQLRSKVKVDDNQITVNSMFSGSFTTTFDDIVLDSFNPEAYRLKTKSGRKISVNSMQTSYERFFAKIKSDVSRTSLTKLVEIEDNPDIIPSKIVGSIPIIIMCIFFIVLGSLILLIASAQLFAPHEDGWGLFFIALIMGGGFLFGFVRALKLNLNQRKLKKNLAENVNYYNS